MPPPLHPPTGSKGISSVFPESFISFISASSFTSLLFSPFPRPFKQKQKKMEGNQGLTNAKQEFMKAVNYPSKIKCVSIVYENQGRGWGETRKVVLKLNYVQDEYKEFLNLLDLTYKGGFSDQELYGIVLFEDGSWLSRVEYDGSLQWKHNISPVIPPECL